MERRLKRYCTLLVVALLANVYTQASQAALVMLQNKNSEKCVQTISASKPPVGSNIVQGTCAENRIDDTAQGWVFWHNGKIKSRASNLKLCLSIENGSKKNGANVVLGKCGGKGSATVFVRKRVDSSHFFLLKSRQTKKCVTVANASTKEGAKLVQMPCVKSSEQQFKETLGVK